jgi:hypothetical protein
MSVTDTAAHETAKIVEQIRPILRGHHRSVQWAVLAELIAIWLVEHVAVEPKLLEPLLRVHINTVRRLVGLYHDVNGGKNGTST